MKQDAAPGAKPGLFVVLERAFPYFEEDGREISRDLETAKIRKRFANVEMPMAKLGLRAKYCVIPGEVDPIVFQVAQEKGFAICVGEVATPDLGFSLHADRPAGAVRVDEKPEPETKNVPPLKIAKVAPLRAPGTPISYVQFIQSLSLNEGSMSVQADRHLKAGVKTRDGEEIAIGLQGPTLHILLRKVALGKVVERTILVPITNCVKLHVIEDGKAE